MVRPGAPQPEGGYAVALADELGDGVPIGADFLDGRLVLYRGADGTPIALDARCPHLGADLSLGDVEGDDHHVELEIACVSPETGPSSSASA